MTKPGPEHSRKRGQTSKRPRLLTPGTTAMPTEATLEGLAFATLLEESHEEFDHWSQVTKLELWTVRTNFWWERFDFSLGSNA